jgi:DNA-directed RNA polymerase omega subunit
VHDLLQKVDNKFMLCMAVARRARQIKEGAKPLQPESDSELPVIAAMEELLGNKVGVDHESEAAIEAQAEIKVLRRKTRDKVETPAEASEEDQKKEASKLKKKMKLEKSKRRSKSLVA